MPSPYDLIQQARRKHGALDVLPRQEQWVSIQAGASDRMRSIQASEQESPVQMEYDLIQQQRQREMLPPPESQQPAMPPLYPQITPPGVSASCQQPAAIYAPPAYQQSPSQYAPTHQPPAQPYMQPQHDPAAYAPQYAPQPQYAAAYQPHPSLIDPPEPVYAGHPQIVTWNKPGAQRQQRQYGYPPAGTPFAQMQPQPTSNYMLPPPSASQGKHVHLDKIHQRHDDALKDIMFHHLPEDGADAGAGR